MTSEDTQSETEKTRVGHTKTDSTDVYVGRGPGGCDMTTTAIGDRGWLGNPFTLEAYSREESINRFRDAFVDRLEEDEEFRDAVSQLRGKTLGCWCQRVDEDEPACHGEVIAKWADRLATDDSED